MSTSARTTASAARIAAALCLTLALSAAAYAQAVRPEVIGYFPSWKWKSQNALANPAAIPYEKFTIIDYAFFAPLPDGEIRGKNSDADRYYLTGNPDSTLIGLAHRHGVNVLLSIGGWGDSQNFPAVASTPTLRAAFAHSCVQALRDYGFDGIDIDWEFPGYREHGGGPADTENFTLLLSLLRDSLDNYGKRGQKRCLLTAALPSGGENLQNMEVGKIARMLDQLNIMTYDFYGVWDTLSGHNAPLYPSAGSDTARCIDASFRRFRDFYGVPASRINIGVPFYGHTYTDCVALNTPHGGEDTVHFPRSGAFFANIAAMKEKFVRQWDQEAKVPYLVSTAWKILVTYDDEESVRAKARYVLEKGIHGVIIWEITADNMPDRSTPLLDALTTALGSPSPAVH